MEYIVGGYTMINDIVLDKDHVICGKLGGSVFSAAGVKLWNDSVAYVGVAGEDFEALYSEFLDNNGIQRAMLAPFPETLRYRMTYSENGAWSEVCANGPEYEESASKASCLHAGMFKGYCGEDTKGIYVEASVRQPVTDEFCELKKMMPHGKLMWEIASSDLYCPELRGRVLSVIETADIYSMNYHEARAFFGVDSVADAVERLKGIGKPCFFRAGTDGACMIDGGKAEFLPAVGTEDSVDPTGCGNCSTAAALVGFAEGRTLKETVAMANVAAWLNARQYGPWPVCDQKTRTAAWEKFHELTG